jgi:hypothetical protein
MNGRHLLVERGDSPGHGWPGGAWLFPPPSRKKVGKKKLFPLTRHQLLTVKRKIGNPQPFSFMATTLTIHDETPSGQKTNTFTIDCLTERLTVRDLIKARVYQEAQDYNLKQPEYFRGLVEPTQAERVLNGYKLKSRRQIDWQEQYERALEAFDRNGFFVLVGDKQSESLDQEFEVKVDTEVSFVKLVPLVGG